jgi:ATP-binding cassette subfamily C protein CydD
VEIGLRLLHSGIDFQTAFFILLIAPEFYLPLRMLGLKFHAGMTGQTAAIEFYEMLASIPDEKIKETDQTQIVEKDILLSFNHVSFQYTDGQEDVLHDVSFDCKPGSVTALIGRSGSGKSTLAKLALRFLEPDSGTIMMNETPANEIPVAQWYQQIAWLGQKSFYAEGTVLENIQFANPQADQDDILLALERVGLRSKIENLPAGLLTPISEFGMNFSGGEVQRLQIARALISNASMLILDEPTSQLDADLEALFITELENLRKTRTVLLIAHRLQTVLHADTILVLENGTIVEQGDHETLIKQDGRYHQMIHAYQSVGGL